MSIDNKLLDRLYNPSLKLRFQALKEIVSKYDKEAIPTLRKFLFLEKDKDLIFYARKSLDILTKEIKNEINTLSMSDGELIHTLFSGTASSKINILQKIINLNIKKYNNYLIDLLKDEKDYFVIATLIKAIGYNGNSSNISDLSVFLDSKDSRVRSNTIEALSCLGNQEVLPLILPMLKDENARVKVAAANFLITHSKEINLDKLILNMSLSESISELSALIFLIQSVKNPKYIHILEKLVKHKNSRIKQSADSLLSELKNITLSDSNINEITLLDNMLSKIKKEDIPEKKAIVPETFHNLIAKLESTENPDELKKYILKLEKLGDTRAIEYIKKINSESKVVNYFIDRALEKLYKLQEKVFICPSCGYQIRRESLHEH